jgi:hypothetical protein
MTINATWQNILTETLGAFLAGKLSFTIEGYSIAIASTSGAPVRFTLAAAIAGAEQVFLGETGEVQIGNALVTVAKAPPYGSNASPQSADIAAAIAATITPVAPHAAAAPASHTDP